MTPTLRLTGKQLAVGAGVLALAGAGVGIGLAATSGPSCPSLSTIASGGVYSLGSCSYNVGVGLVLTHPTTITGGTFTSTASTAPVKPIIKIDDVANVSISKATISGPNTKGKFAGKLVGASGIKLVETMNVTLTNDTVKDTWGDCLEAFAEPPKQSAPNTGLVADHDTLDHCGRDGITPADITDSSFDHITIGQKGQSGIDAESDIVGLGMGNVTFNDSTIPGIVMIETLTGPVSYGNDIITGRFQFRSRNGQKYPVLVTGGTFKAGIKSKPSIIWQSGVSNLTFAATTFTRPNGGSAPLWSATNHAILNLTANGTLPSPLGTSDSTSTVTISP